MLAALAKRYDMIHFQWPISAAIGAPMSPVFEDRNPFLSGEIIPGATLFLGPVALVIRAHMFAVLTLPVAIIDPLAILVLAAPFRHIFGSLIALCNAILPVVSEHLGVIPAAPRLIVGGLTGLASPLRAGPSRIPVEV
jgi:hypothetical protein